MQRAVSIGFGLVLGVLTLVLQGCDQWPADPRNSLNSALERGTLRVGVIANPPWVELADPTAPTGVESDLVAQFAAEHDLVVDWRTGGVEEQIEALRAYELDLLIGGFTRSNPWKAEVGNSFPHHEDRVLLTPPGENALLMAVERFLFQQQENER